jgi:hypothetical protein
MFDVLALLGLVLLGAGLWQVAPALSLSVVGGLLVALSILGAWIDRRGA